jgi:hypothetical protein
MVEGLVLAQVKDAAGCGEDGAEARVPATSMPDLLAAHTVLLVQEREHEEGGGFNVGIGAMADG